MTRVGIPTGCIVHSGNDCSANMTCSSQSSRLSHDGPLLCFHEVSPRDTRISCPATLPWNEPQRALMARRDGSGCLAGGLLKFTEMP